MKKKSILLIGLLVVFAGCAKKQMLKPSPGSGEQSQVMDEEPSIRFDDWSSAPELDSIRFDYDKAELLPAAREALKKNAVFLEENPQFNILVEGHCDERGTIEYNLSLGQRRASAVRDYYGKLGVSLSRIGTLSYGEEKPLDLAHTEEAWGKNRRAETKVRNSNKSSAPDRQTETGTENKTQPDIENAEE